MNEDFELDEQLYEVSKWEETYQYWFFDPEDGLLLVDNDQSMAVLSTCTPRYDLEYLLDKLKITADWTHGRFDLSNYCDMDGVYEWAASYNSYDNDFPIGKANTPRQAVLKLAIELFKKGILKPAGEKE